MFKMQCNIPSIIGIVLKFAMFILMMNFFRKPVSAIDWETAGPDVLKSHVIAPLFNQTYPGCWLGSQFYMVGDRWSPSINPHGLMECVKCQCAQVVKKGRVQMEGKVLCTNIKQECPKPRCATPILRPSTCCKICPGQDTSFEDQFSTIEYPTSSNPVLQESKLLQKDMSALLVGGGRQKHGSKPVRTRAVAIVHITNTTGDSFNYAIRYSRLKDPVFFKITDEYGNPVIVRRIPKQMSRSGTIYDKVVDIPKNYVRYVLHHNAYVTITTSRHRKGEIHGRIRINTVAAAASFEALLNPPDKSGIGAIFTMFYDVTTKMASFVIQIDGFRLSRIDEYFVTFEKDTEIIHQHLLRLSYQKNQMVGKVSVDSRMSKQIARGRLHVRVTSRAGETMVGLLRPRLLRTGMIATVTLTNQTVGYVLLTLLDDGSLRYKVSVDSTFNASITVALQRQIKNFTRWKDFAVLLKDPDRFVLPEDTDRYIKPRFEEEGLLKKLRARDIVLIQNAAFRVKVTINEGETYSRIHTVYRNLDFLFGALDILLRSLYCEAAAFVFYEVSENCSHLNYYVISSGARDETTDMTLVFESKHAGSVTKRLIYPEGAIRGIANDVFRDLNHGKVTARLRVSDDICDLYEGKKNQMVGKVSVDSRMSKQIARGRLHVRVTSRAGETMVGLLRPRLLRTGMIATVTLTNQTVGYVLLTLLDDGSLRYKEEGLLKKLRARDIVLIQNAAFRVKVTINEGETYSRIHTVYRNLDFLFGALDILLRSLYCEAAAFVFYEVSENCSHLNYYVISSGARDETTDMTLVFESKHAGSVTKRLIYPEGAIRGIANDVFRDLNHGKVTARLRVSDDICDLYEGKVIIRNKCWRTKYTALDPSSETDSQENGLEMDTSDTFRCYYEGRFYAHAKSWLPIDGNPCVTCRCNRGNVHCDQMVCPPTSCKYPIKRDGECCHICDDDNDTERKHSGSCYFDGDKRWHPVGTSWHPYVPPFGYSKCALCNCVKSSLEVNCTRIPCPELTCPKQQRVRVKPDDCCQLCRGDNDAGLRSQNIFMKVKPKGKEGCTFGGSLYQHGDKWRPVLHPFGEMKCYTCTCKNGKSRCRKQKCQPLDCKQQYRPSGKCCPVCSEKLKAPRTVARNGIIG